MKHTGVRRFIMVLGAAVVLASGRGASADEPNAILDLLEHKGIITHEEAEQARKYYEKQTKEAVVKNDKMKVSSWIDEMRWSGSLRLRAEDQSFEPALDLANRLRYRYTLRLGLDIKVQDWANIGVRLASGETSPGNAVSANATMTSEFTKKPINIELAYATIHPPMMDWLSATGGKMIVPIWKPVFNSPLTYDVDLTVEGTGENLTWKFGDKNQHKVFVNAGQFALQEFSSNENDAYLFDQQAGFQAQFDPVTITAAGGYYLTHNLQNVTTNGNLSGNSGNSAAGSTYLSNFNNWYLDGQVDWQISQNPFLGTTAVLKLSGEFLSNENGGYSNDPLGDATQGWSAQIGFGEAVKKQQWMVAYQYRRLEANATLDVITDDDFGAGGTDRKGHVIKSAYNLFDWWQLGFTAYITEKIDGNRTGPNSQPGVVGETRLRLMADTTFKF